MQTRLLVTAIAILLALALCGCPSSSGGPPPDDGDPTTPPPASTWSKSFGGAGDDWANSVIPTRDGGYLVAGVLDHQELSSDTSRGLVVEGDFWVTKLDTLGDTVWQQAVGERRSSGGNANVTYKQVRAVSDGYWMVGTQVTAGPSGNLFASDVISDVIVARLNDDGSVRFTRTFDSGGFATREFFRAGETARDQGWDITPTRDGGALIAAWSNATLRVDANNGIPAAAPWILKVDASGQRIWSRRISEQQFADYVDGFAPMQLLVRETAGNGAVVASSSRMRATGIEQYPNPALHLSLLDSGGGVYWTHYQSAFLARDVIQVEDDLDGAANDGFVVVGDDLALRYLLDGDDDVIAMKFSRETGEEEWRVNIEEGLRLDAVTQVCTPTVLLPRNCWYVAVGTGRPDDEGEWRAMAVFIRADGDSYNADFYDDLDAARDVRVSVPGTVAAGPRLQILTGGLLTQSSLLNVDTALNALDRTMLASSDVENPPNVELLRFENDGRVSGLNQQPDGDRLRVFSNAGVLTLDRLFGGTGERRGERAFAAVEVADGYVVAGRSDSLGGDTLVVKLLASGAVSWQRVLDNVTLRTLRGTTYSAIAESGDGGVVLAGTLTGASGRRAGLVKLDANGGIAWTSLLDSTNVVRETIATGITRRNGGGYYVSALTDVIGDDGSPFVMQFDDSGAPTWARDVPLSGHVGSVAALPDGGVVMSIVTSTFSEHSLWAMRFAGNGDAVWLKRFEAGRADHDPTALIVPVASGGFLLGASHLVNTSFDTEIAQANAGRRNIVFIRLGDDGTPRWNRVYGAALNETLFGLAATTDGGFVAAGRSDSLGEGAEAWVLRLGGDGMINAGCNALRSESAFTNYSTVSASPTVWAALSRETALGVGSNAGAVPARAVRETVMARQCAGAAQADGGGASPARVRLTVAQGNATGPGVVTSAPAGIACGTASNNCTADYYPNTSVILGIDPQQRTRFLGWSGCDTASGDTCIVNMTADRTVTATFRPADAPRFRLTVDGNGRVSGAGLDCRNGNAGTCQGLYTAGEILALTASADSGEAFLGWGGACAASGTGTPINVTISGNLDCSAQFTGGPAGSPRVTISLAPAGIANLIGYVRSTPVGINCGSTGTDCTQTFAAGSTVRLDGIPTDANYLFESFTCGGTNEVIGARAFEFVINGNVNCQGRFATGIERLEVRRVADGGIFPGRVVTSSDPNDGSLDCSTDCDRPFTRNSVIMLRGDPVNGGYLSGWSGCDAVIPDPTVVGREACRVTMSRSRLVVAFFSQFRIGSDQIEQLAISFPYTSAGGSVTLDVPLAPACTPGGDPSACLYGYSDDREVVLIIRPDGNNTLNYNEGCDTFTPAAGGNPATCRVVVDRDRGVVFNFGLANDVPVAVITVDPSGPVAVGQTVQFSAAGSNDDGGTAGLSYQWDFNEDLLVDATTREAAYAWNAPGTYTVHLAVLDALGAVGRAQATVEVSAANAPPVASFVFAPASPRIGDLVTFDASASSDDAAIVLYSWDFDGDGIADATGVGNAARVRTFAYTATGTYVARLTVTDAEGLTSQTTRMVTVTTAPGALTLTLNLQGSGHGVVTYLPVVTACSKDSEPTCVRQFAPDTTVVLTALAYSGSTLGDWVGCTSLSADGRQCTVALTSSRTVTLFIN